MKPSVAFTLLVTGFLGFCPAIHAAAYTFTTIEVPFAGAQDTYAWGINDSGQIAGFYTEPGSAICGLSCNHGFLDSGGVFTSIDAPFTSPGLTQAYGINSSGQIVGGYYSPTTGAHGFLDDGGIFIPIAAQLAGAVAYGINARGQIVGGYAGAGREYGFLDNNEIYSTIDVPSGGVFSEAFGINDAGQIVGVYQGPAGSHGFLDNGGLFSTIDVPFAGCGNTEPTGINNEGQIVGIYSGCPGGPYGFLDSGGVFSTISVPFAGATGTEAFGINDRGQVVGLFFDSTGGRHGFLATPIPEPTTLLLLTTGLAGIVILIWRKRIPKHSAL
jgi:probable HAF family extracellular repeat protein